MKKKYQELIKNGSFIGCLSLALILPVTTLTACSTISQYLVPVITNNNPFGGSASASGTNIQTGTSTSLTDPYFAQGQFYDADTQTRTSITNTNAIVPNSYIYTSAFDNSFQANATNYYGYTNHNAPSWNKDDTNRTAPWDFNQPAYEDDSYLSYSDSRLDYADSTTLTSYENLLNAISIETVNSTSGNLVTFFGYVNNFIVHVLEKCKTSADFDKALSILFTNSDDGFDHGQAMSTEAQITQNKEFYQYFMSEANLLSTSAVKYKFGPYLNDWYVVDSGLEDGNTSPFPITTLTSITASKDNEKSSLIPECYMPGSTTNQLIGLYQWNDDSQDFTYIPPDNSSHVYCPYNVYQYKDNGDGTQTITDISYIANVPVLIRMGNITSSYYNPSKNRSSITPADWLYYDNQLSNINSQINETKAWNNVRKTSGISDLSLTAVQHKQTMDDLSLSGKTLDWMGNFSDQTNPKIDPTIKNWYDNQQIQPGDFIALANYSLYPITINYKDQDGNDVHYKTKLPFFSGFGSVFPAYLAFIGDDAYTTTNDKLNDDQYAYLKRNVVDFADGTTLYKKFSSIISNLTDFAKALPSSAAPYESSAKAFTDDDYFILWWLFGHNTTGNYTGGTSSSSNYYWTTEI